MSVLAFAPGRLTAEGPAARLTGHVSAGDPRATGRRVVEEGLVSAESSFFIDAGYERSGHTFEFVDVSDLQRQRLNRIGELVSIGIGYGTTGTFEGIKAPQPLFYAALTFTGGRSFTAGTKQQICIPIAGSLATKCLTTAITGPQSADPQIWKAESRVWLREQKIGLNPEFVYDADQSIRELALNVSALVFKKGESKPAYELDTTALSAGFRIGYIFEGERKGAAASVFFSSVLGMW
jgi:hypothetical protein